MDHLPEDFFVTSMQFTRDTYRDVYPGVDPTSTDLSMTGKVVVITGASQGIGGRGIAPAFAKAGAKAIILVARSEQKLNETASTLTDTNPSLQVMVAPRNITDTEAVKSLFEKINATFGHADILINNAGVMKANGTVAEIEPQQWWEEVETNGRGTYNMTTYFLKSLPHDHRGTIINLTSGMAFGVYPGNSAYSLGKLLNLQLAAYVAAENSNVTSVALHPGLVHSGTTAPAFERFALDTSELVGGVSVWLSSEKGRFMNGRYMNVNWSVDDLTRRQEEIKKEGLLQIDLTGKFGYQQFSP
ncbi:hypothetical protein GGI35DRAFT_470707 [Trichoderma velutinum]